MICINKSWMVICHNVIMCKVKHTLKNANVWCHYVNSLIRYSNYFLYVYFKAYIIVPVVAYLLINTAQYSSLQVGQLKYGSLTTMHTIACELAHIQIIHLDRSCPINSHQYCKSLKWHCGTNQYIKYAAVY